MADLVVLVPSRGRPGNVARLVAACRATCTADVLLMWGFDEDDPCLQENLAAAQWHSIACVRPRMGLAAWTNYLCRAEIEAGPLGFPYLASIGDDMVPVTTGWDTRLTEACGTTGMAYPNDRRRDDIPEAIVMTSDIVRALGWMSQPGLNHFFQDAVWRDIGVGAGCLRYLPDVIVEHRHPNVPGGDPPDATYGDAALKFSEDMAAYQKWRLHGMREDIKKVAALCRR